MKRIKQLSENLINQIAAGEVIEKPASVVKELVENAVDAGSTRIEVEISNECRNIRVADNGSGIHPEDVKLAFSRHATSKINIQKDLWNISSLGFRGEALASIISIAKVSCTTRTEDADNGIRVECENSEIKVTPAGCSQGTIMEVKDLFYNTPVRKKFLKKPQTEYASITEVMQNIAISHPKVAFNLIHKGHSSLKTSASNDLATVLSEVYSSDLISELVEINNEDTQAGLKIDGFSSNPDFTRSNKKAIYIFVNGRTVKCPVLLRAIDNAYKNMIPNGRYPFVVINLSLPKNEIDVNVHPAKREIRYTNTNIVFSFVHHSIKNALQSTGYVTQLVEQPTSDIVAYNKQEITPFKRESINFTIPTGVPVNFSELKMENSYSYQDTEVAEQKSFSFSSEDINEQQDNNKIKIIGQYDNTYILIEAEEGLQLVDQHIAHERYLYEKLKEEKEFASQLLLASTKIELEPSEVSVLSDNIELLKKFGYIFEIINDKTIVLKQVPQIISNKGPETVVGELLEALNGSVEDIEDKILTTTACKASVKAGEKLSIWQMEELIRNWMTTKFPKTCPHGRPISHIIPLKQVASFFGRSE